MDSLEQFSATCRKLSSRPYTSSELEELRSAGERLFDEFVGSGQQYPALEVIELLKSFTAIPDRIRVYEARARLLQGATEDHQDLMAWMLLRFLETGPRKIYLNLEESAALFEYVRDVCPSHPLLQRETVRAWLESR